MDDQLELVILTRNRPDYFKKILDSILVQSHKKKNFNILISDNSSNNETFKIYSSYRKYDNLSYIKRNNLSSHNHFSQVIDNLTGQYSILLHDDDIMKENFISEVFKYLPKKEFVATAFNAELIDMNDHKLGIKMHNLDRDMFFFSPKEFLKQYLPGNKGICPFPSYVYNTKILKRAYREVHDIAGKHSDVIILSRLLKYGNIMWKRDTVMFYRVHKGSDSYKENIVDRIKLIKEMKVQGINKNYFPLELFRIYSWLRWLKQNKYLSLNMKSWRGKIVLCSILQHVLRFLFKRNFWFLILSRCLKALKK